MTLSTSFPKKATFDFSLTNDQINEVHSILQRGDPRTEYSNLGGYSIMLRDLQTLRDSTWLNDNVFFRKNHDIA